MKHESYLSKKLRPLLAALLLLVAPPAFAASYTAPAVVTWAGPYAGLDFGATWGDFYNGPSGTGGNASGGGLAGYNWQLGNIILGGEADVSGMSVPAKSAASRFDEDWMMSFRGRAGYVWGNYLPFATLGIAITSTTWSLTAGGSNTTIRPGLTFGGGVDAILSGNWFLRGEYLYTRVPSETVKIGATSLNGGSNNGTIRAALGYRF